FSDWQEEVDGGFRKRGTESSGTAPHYHVYWCPTLAAVKSGRFNCSISARTRSRAWGLMCTAKTWAGFFSFVISSEINLGVKCFDTSANWAISFGNEQSIKTAFKFSSELARSQILSVL